MKAADLLIFASLLMIAGSGGCSSKPDRVRVPRVNPSAAARQAMETYDQNSDNLLDADELKACPSMLADLGVYDGNGDGAVDASEIEARVRKVLDLGIGLRPLDAKVTLDRVPLAGATVHLEPEPFWGEGLFPAKGVTNRAGLARLKVESSNLPEQVQGMAVVVPGSYKIRVVDPKGRVPERYDTASPLGKDVGTDIVTGPFDITLRSR